MVNLYRERDNMPNNRSRAKTGAERLRDRKRLRDDPVKYEEYLKKERERNSKRREEGKLKTITELSSREQRQQRREWRTRQKKHRMMKRQKEVAVCRDMPPSTSTESEGKKGTNQKNHKQKNMDIVKTFLSRDDNSRISAGKKETITRFKTKKQKRFLSDTMLNLYQKLMMEMPHLKLSYSLLCRIKPFWIVAPNISNRETCVCKVHDNATKKAQRLKQLGIINSQSLNKVAEKLCRDTRVKACMYRECISCKNKSLTHTKKTSGAGVTWSYQWVTKKEDYEKEKDGKRETITVTKTIEQRCEGSTEHLLEDFEKEMKDKVCKYLFNIQHQYTQLQSLHRSLKEDEAIIHIDYAENWQCKYSKEVQQVHFGASHRQTTLHNAVLYTTENTLTFCVLSPSMKHDPAAIWAELAPVLQFLRVNHPKVQKLFFISDGPTVQYRGKKNFYLMSIIPFQMGFNAVNWSFLEACHGKGPADGVGATIKRTADSQVARGTDIPTAKALYDTLLPLTKVKLFYVEEEQISTVSARLPEKLPTIKGTLSIHQVICMTPGIIHYRVLSCFCNREAICPCFEPVSTNIAPLTQPSRNVCASAEPPTQPQTLDVKGLCVQLMTSHDVMWSRTKMIHILGLLKMWMKVRYFHFHFHL